MTWNLATDFLPALPMQRYRLDHPWYPWHDEPMFDVVSAWRIYRRARNPSLGFVLLGHSKLRQDPTLVHAFGLMSAAGVQSEDERRMVAAVQIQSWWRGTDLPDLKTGSILSDQNWSPLLNDALILGGVHAAREFHFTDEALAGYGFQQLPGVAGVRAAHELQSRAAQQRLAPLADRPWPVQVWRAFFQDHQDVLWDGTRHVPRVLARELVGLMRFGYEAVLTPQQLGFVPGAGGVRQDFSAYLAALHEAGYFARDGQRPLLARISHYLFGSAEALR